MSACRRQFSFRALGFGGEDPYRFALPQAKWPWLPGSFIVYRTLFGLYQLTVFILLVIYWGMPPLYSEVDVKAKWLIFISNWSFLNFTIYAVWSLCTTCYWHIRGRKTVADAGSQNNGDIALKKQGKSEVDVVDSGSVEYIPQTPWYMKINWVLQVIACSTELAVTLLFWIIEFSPGSDSVHFFSVNVHGVGAVLVIIDFMLVANPFRILHFIYPVIFASVYFLFTFIYHAAGGRNPQGETHIYRNNIDWGMVPGRSVGISVFAAVVGATALHFLFFLLYLVKISFSKCCGCCKPSSPVDYV